MDGGISLPPDEIKGCNTWLVWTGGNDRFWDVISYQPIVISRHATQSSVLMPRVAA